ncbi:hypothetical protein SpCBS45565_g03172 [Spizellomyces sp. 'palustris']|nr:hypothetical protein SpCBS45565_g03172 [Spizellomyces sp. 'palustris']
MSTDLIALPDNSKPTQGPAAVAAMHAMQAAAAAAHAAHAVRAAQQELSAEGQTNDTGHPDEGANATSLSNNVVSLDSMDGPHLPLLPHATPDKPYACDKCDQTFSRQHNLKSHSFVHSRERPFTCDVCSQAFSRQHDLKRHQRLHDGVKPYKCPHCHRDFSRLDALNRHMRVEGSSAPCCGLNSFGRISRLTSMGTQLKAKDDSSAASVGSPFAGTLTDAPGTPPTQTHYPYPPPFLTAALPFGMYPPPSMPVTTSAATSAARSPTAATHHFHMYHKPGEPAINVSRIGAERSADSSLTASPTGTPTSTTSSLPVPPPVSVAKGTMVSAGDLGALIDRNEYLENRVRELEVEVQVERKFRGRREWLETRVRELEIIEKALLTTIMESKDPNLQAGLSGLRKKSDDPNREESPCDVDGIRLANK